MKKFFRWFAITVQILMLSLCVGFFAYGKIPFPSATRAADTQKQVSELQVEKPKDLEELQNATSSDYDSWVNLEKFDGRDYNYITKTKNQGGLGICWAYAAVGAVETSILREGIDEEADKDNLNLDELVAAYLSYNRNGTNDPLNLTENDKFDSENWRSQGGHANGAFLAMTQGYSPVDKESKDSFSDSEVNSLVKESKYFVQSYTHIAKDNESIKRAILKYGAVTMEYHSGSYKYMYYDKDNRETSSLNHASIIIGWDDSIPISNFSPNKPSENGAWIVKNSWGNYGDYNNGTSCFYLSYESNFGDFFVVDMAMKKDYPNLYYYDGQVSSNPSTYVADEQGAIYEAKLSTSTMQEQLKAVVVDFKNTQVTVNVKVYKGLEVNPGNVNDNMNIPVQNKPVAEKSVYFERDGLYTIDLDKPVNLEQGEYFSVVVSGTDYYNNTLWVICGRDGTESTNDMTYYSYNGQWHSYKGSSDVFADESNLNLSARIRAVTKTVPRDSDLGNSLEYARVDIPNRLFHYEKGTAQIPEIKVYFGDDLLRVNQDYTLSISDNEFPGQATVKVTGIGSYTGERTTTFVVTKAKYPPGRINEKTITVYNDIIMLHDIPISSDWKWIDNDFKLKLGLSDFSYSIRYIGEDAEFYRYTTCSFYVNKLNEEPPEKLKISEAEILILGDYIYNGSKIIPEVKVSFEGKDLTENFDYKLSFENNIDAGNATVTIKGIGAYGGQVSKSFVIKQAESPDKRPNSEISVSRKIKTLKGVSLNCNGWSWENPDQEIIGENFTAVARYFDAKNYKNITVSVTIKRILQKQIGTLNITLEKKLVVYDGPSNMPKVIAFDSGIKLVQGEDFEVRYETGIVVGGLIEATAIVSGLNDYIGTLNISFNIEKAEKPKVETSIYTDKTIKDLSEVEPPQNFEWVENSMQIDAENKMTAKARYVGEDAEYYNNTVITFEIFMPEKENEQMWQPGGNNVAAWIYYVIAGALILVFAGVITVILVRKNNSSKSNAR